MAPGILTIIKIYLKESEQMDTPIPEFLAEAANKRVSDIFIIAGRPLAEKIDGHLFSSGDRLMPAETEALLRTLSLIHI